MQARLPFSRLIHPFDLRMTISIQRTFERTIWTRHTVTCEYCESHKLNSQWIKIKWGCLGGLACHGKRLWTMSAGSTFSRGPGDLFIDSFHCLTGCWCKTFWLNVALRTPTGPTMMARTSKDIQTLTLLMMAICTDPNISQLRCWYSSVILWGMAANESGCTPVRWAPFRVSHLSPIACIM